MAIRALLFDERLNFDLLSARFWRESGANPATFQVIMRHCRHESCVLWVRFRRARDNEPEKPDRSHVVVDLLHAVRVELACDKGEAHVRARAPLYDTKCA
eukprot:3907471-Pleurochrysis_carterae.AAC.1